jgi:hypothetical protein
MATGNSPTRPGAGLPAAIEVPSRETPAVPPEPLPEPLPVPVVSEPDEPPAKPEPRHLDTAELVSEGTRLIVGALVGTGRGLRAIVEQAVATVEAAEGDDAAVGEADPADDAGRPVAALRAPDPPDTVLGALPTAALGAGLHAQRRVMAAVVETREMYGPVVTWVLEAPGVSAVYRRARADVFAWYERGAADKAAGAGLAVESLKEVSDGGLGYVFDNLDLNTILDGFDINPLLSNLELNDVIVSSTGGIATEALDSVRSQGVTVDDIIARISNRVFRRKPERVPEGPPGEFGLQEELPPWTSR